MGHRHAGGQESHKPDADGESGKEDHRQRGTEASMDLRKLDRSVFTRYYVIREQRGFLDLIRAMLKIIIGDDVKYAIHL